MRSDILNPGGVVTTVAVQDGALVTGTTQDCTPIAEWAKRQHNAGFHGSSEMRLAARIPAVMVEKYLNDNAITLHEFTGSQDHQRRLLSDPALAHFRIWPGRV